MTVAVLLLTSLSCAGLCAATRNDAPPVIACHLNAISAAERPRYNDLMKRLRSAIRHRSEITDGYAFELNGTSISLPEIAEWIGMERLCCPFLTFQLSASGNPADWELQLTGPKGVKALLQTEFPSRP